MHCLHDVCNSVRGRGRWECCRRQKDVTVLWFGWAAKDNRTMDCNRVCYRPTPLVVRPSFTCRIVEFVCSNWNQPRIAHALSVCYPHKLLFFISVFLWAFNFRFLKCSLSLSLSLSLSRRQSTNLMMPSSRSRLRPQSQDGDLENWITNRGPSLGPSRYSRRWLIDESRILNPESRIQNPESAKSTHVWVFDAWMLTSGDRWKRFSYRWKVSLLHIWILCLTLV